METLIDALVMYAAEHRTPRFEQETALQTRAALREVEELVEQLKALSPEVEAYLEKLREKLVEIDRSYERATLLCGISIGLDLGRLGSVSV